jgi:hypothetical protein
VDREGLRVSESQYIDFEDKWQGQGGGGTWIPNTGWEGGPKAE